MDGLELRRATAADLCGILSLYAQPGLDDGAVLPLDRAEQIFSRMERYPDYHLYVGVRDGQVVGTYALLVIDNLGHLGAPSGLVEDVAVAPECQGQGIGKAMIRHAMAICRDKGCYKMALSANLKREKAHAFYESLGMRRHGFSFLVEF